MPAPAAAAAAASAVPQGVGFLQAPVMPVAMPQPMMLPWMQMQMMMPPHLMQQMPTTAAASTAAPNGVAAAQQAAREISSDPSKTTLMWKNLPNNFTRDELLELMDAQGFAGSYNFFYAPVDFTSGALVGYAFVNFVSLKEANRFIIHFQGFSAWGLRSEKVAEVQWSSCQGLEEHVERYRNSPVMHPDVSEEKRPVLFVNGVRVQFPKPTRKLRAPHLKECRRRD
jgi:RNA recognition motif-containing protein